jgi:hypothetical protein
VRATNGSSREPLHGIDEGVGLISVHTVAGIGDDFHLRAVAHGCDDVSGVIGRRRRIAVPGHDQDRAVDLAQMGKQVVGATPQLDEACHDARRHRLHGDAPAERAAKNDRTLEPDPLTELVHRVGPRIERPVVFGSAIAAAVPDEVDIDELGAVSERRAPGLEEGVVDLDAMDENHSGPDPHPCSVDRQTFTIDIEEDATSASERDHTAAVSQRHSRSWSSRPSVTPSRRD